MEYTLVAPNLNNIYIDSGELLCGKSYKYRGTLGYNYSKDAKVTCLEKY